MTKNLILTITIVQFKVIKQYLQHIIKQNLPFINIKSMESYFSAIQPHLQDHVDIAIVSNSETSNSKAILSLGIDNLIYIKDLTSNDEERIYLPENDNYKCIAKSTASRKCFLGSDNGYVNQYNLDSQETKQTYKSQYKVHSLTSSPKNRYLAIASQQSKCVLIDLQTYRTSKCRPGHDESVANAFFSLDLKYLASIGMDRSLLIYNIQNFDQPLQEYRFKICKSNQVNPMMLKGSFHKVLPIFYSPGMKELQIIELLNNKWEYRQSNFIKHLDKVILLVSVVKSYLLVTCNNQQFFIWNNKNEEKMIVIQNFTLNKIIQCGESFWGCANDGKIYFYEKVLNENIAITTYNRQQNQKMEIQNQNKFDGFPGRQNNDVINFDDEAEEQDQQQDQDKKQDVSEQQYKFAQQKKSKADKIITAYPQQKISNSTSFFDNARYIMTNQIGYLVQRRQNEFQSLISFQYESKDITESIFLNKSVMYADFNTKLIAYANETTFGITYLNKRQMDMLTQDNRPIIWEKSWLDIIGVVCSYQWIAVANEMEIKIFDLCGNQLKTICFDRQIVAISAYENLLAVAYHESIPIWGSQCLAMQLYVINPQKAQALKCSSCHVPVKTKSLLKYFRFTQEGMLLTQDDAGFIRVYNLQTNTWTNVIIQNIEDSRRIWILGMENYELIYWKTSQKNPDPEVFPRLPLKKSRLGISVAIDESEQMQNYQYLLFERFCLDHEKCRNRLWGHLKQSRKQTHPFCQTSDKILTQKQLLQRHNQLDYKFMETIKYFLKNKMYQKALMSVKTLIRTIQVGKKFVEMFDDFKLRTLSVDLEIYWEEKQREMEYEVIQALELDNLKLEAEKNIKPKGQNNPFTRKKNQQSLSIPSLNNTQLSQASNFDSLSQRSEYKGTKKQNKIGNIPLHTPQKQQFVNPFLKKRSNDEDINNKSKQIQEQIERYGVKKKSQINKKTSKL